MSMCPCLRAHAHVSYMYNASVVARVCLCLCDIKCVLCLFARLLAVVIIYFSCLLFAFCVFTGAPVVLDCAMLVVFVFLDTGVNLLVKKAVARASCCAPAHVVFNYR